MKYTVYLRRVPDGRVYIGCTSKTLEERAGKGGGGYSYNTEFWKAIQEQGWDNVQTEILTVADTLQSARDTQWMHRYDVKGKIETCMVKPDKVESKLEAGWVLGRGPCSVEANEKRKATFRTPEMFEKNSQAHKGKCCIYRKEGEEFVGKQVTPEDLDSYLADGWVRGRKPSPKTMNGANSNRDKVVGRKRMYHATDLTKPMIYVHPEDIPKYELQRYVVGNKPKK